MQRKLAGIISDDAAGIDDDALGLRALPALPPPGEVISLRVNFRDVRLSPAQRAAIPRKRAAQFAGTGIILCRVCGKCDEVNAREHNRGRGAFFQKGAAGLARLRSRHADNLCPFAPFTPE